MIERMKRPLLVMLATACVMVCKIAKADAIQLGQKVEVREGDTWSPASVIGHEGRKYQIHYDGTDASSDEWVTVDRIRKPGNGATQPASGAKPVTDAGFAVGDKIETKWGGLWRKSVVIRKQNGWTLVQYDNVWYEWVQPWRLRAVDSKQDTALDSRPRGFVDKGTPAPTDSPEAMEKAADPDAFHLNDTVGPQGIPISKAELTGQDLQPGAVAGPAALDPTPTCTPPNMVSLNHGTPTFGVKTTLIVNPQGKFAMLAYTPNGNDSLSIQRIELSRADANRTATLAPNLAALAISPDGRRAITRSDKFFGSTKWRLDLWNIDSETPKALLSFRPYDAVSDGSDAVLWASYLDASHVMTCSGGNSVTLWQITDTSARELYTLQGDATVHPQMSGGGKYLIVGYGGQALICEAMTGKCVAKFTALADTDGMVTALNADVTRLALSGGSRLVVCDLTGDKVLIDTGLPEGVTGTSLGWISSNLLLIDSRWIFDTDHHAMLWEYTFPDDKPDGRVKNPVQPVTCWMGDRLWFLSENGGAVPGRGGKAVLTSINMMDAKVVAADKKLVDGVFVIEPGSRVSLEVNIDCTQDEKQKIVDRLTRRLTTAGFEVADNQNIKLVAESKSVDSHQVTYHTGMTEENVTISNTMESLSFVVDSKTVWSVNSLSRGAAPRMVWHKKDESVADTLKAQNKPRLDWFTSISVPRTILKDADPAGTSVLPLVTGRTRPAR